MLAIGSKTSCTCGSSDARVIYPDNKSYCFSCNTQFTWDGLDVDPNKKAFNSNTNMRTDGVIEAIPERKLREPTCKKYGYQVVRGVDGEVKQHLAPFFCKDKRFTAQHIRNVNDKSNMPFVGDHTNGLLMFGQQLFSQGGKNIYICEGEIDTMSVYQALGSSWPVIGIAGAKGTEKMLKENLQYLSSFDKITLCLDNDDAGREATKVALSILPAGKVSYLDEWPEGCKDPNDILVKHGGTVLKTHVMFKTTEHKPEEVLRMSEVSMDDKEFSVTLYPWMTMNYKLFARRSSEITMWTSGSGMGKSSIMRAVYGNLVKQGHRCAMVMLEESPTDTKSDMLSQILGIPLRKVKAMEAVNRALRDQGEPELYSDIPIVSDDALKDAERKINDAGIMLVDSTKGYDADSLMDNMRYLAVSHGVKHILLDHITIMIESDKNIDDSNKAVDVIMKRLRELALECDINIDIISHIRKKGGGLKSTNKGSEITIEELKGSGGLYQIANSVVALERNQQSEEESNATTVRCLKDRLGGYTGVVCKLEYHSDGSQTEYEDQQEFNAIESEDYG